jgi:hypothetical protein
MLLGQIILKEHLLVHVCKKSFISSFSITKKNVLNYQYTYHKKIISTFILEKNILLMCNSHVP